MDDPTKDTIPRSAVEYCLRKETVSTNPEKYKTHEKFIDYMNDPNISEFGHWMRSNGFNCALTAISVDLEKIPSVTPSAQPVPWDRKTRNSMAGTLQMLRRLAYNIHGVMDVIDDDNVKQLTKWLEGGQDENN